MKKYSTLIAVLLFNLSYASISCTVINIPYGIKLKNGIVVQNKIVCVAENYSYPMSAYQQEWQMTDNKECLMGEYYYDGLGNLVKETCLKS